MEVRAPAAASAAAAPRRYVGDDAGLGDEGGVGGPKGDGRGKEWTVDLCSKRLSLLHRKLRQVREGMLKFFFFFDSRKDYLCCGAQPFLPC